MLRLHSMRSDPFCPRGSQLLLELCTDLNFWCLHYMYY